MVQVLPYVPRFADLIANAIGQGGQAAISGYNTGRENDRAAKIFKQLEDPNLSPIQGLGLFATLPDRFKKGVDTALAGIQTEKQKYINEEKQTDRILGGNRNGNINQPTNEGDDTQHTMGAPPQTNQAPGRVPSGQLQAREGISPGSEESANPGLAAPQGISGEQMGSSGRSRAELEQVAGYKGHKIPAINAYGNTAQVELDRIIEAEKNERLNEREDVKNERRVEAAKKEEENRVTRETKAKNREEINKYSEKYADIGTLRKNVTDAERMVELIKSGKVSFDGNKFQTIISSWLEGKTPLSETFETPEQQELFNLVRPFLLPKELGGSNPSTREVLLALQSQVGKYKGQAANENISSRILDFAKKDYEKGKIILDQKRTENDINPAEFQTNVEKKLNLQEGRKKIKSKPPAKTGYVYMVDEYGKVGEVDVNNVHEATKAGYQIID